MREFDSECVGPEINEVTGKHDINNPNTRADSPDSSSRYNAKRGWYTISYVCKSITMDVQISNKKLNYYKILTFASLLMDRLNT